MLLFSDEHETTGKSLTPNPSPTGEGGKGTAGASVVMSRRILLSFARNRSRSAIDASIIALAYSRFSVGECRGNQSCIFCAWHASTTLIVSPSMT